jgi:hypothetical protein
MSPLKSLLQRDCLNLYAKEKKKLKKTIKKNKYVCLISDTWTSIQNINCMCVIAHWVDSDWKLHKKNFKLLSSSKSQG